MEQYQNSQRSDLNIHSSFSRLMLGVKKATPQ